MTFNGYRIGNTMIGITQMPDRKRPCLYVMKGNTLYPVAYFIRDVPTGMVTCAECKRKYMKSMGYYCGERTHPLNPRGHCERGEK